MAYDVFSKKRGFLASFFVIFFAFLSLSCKAFSSESRIYYDRDEWAYLLHVLDQKPLIQDPGFILSLNDFSLDKEYELNLRLLEQDPKGYFCKFPARYVFLKKYNVLPAEAGDDCVGLHEFLMRAPANKISVIYAAENIFSPSSMMGHVMLKLEGVNQDDIPVQHVISFFTESDGLNIPKLLFDTVFIGTPGYYTLSPYQPVLKHYVVDEQRMVWEYEVNFSEDERKKIAYHLYELKNVKIKYFFHKYNCSTLIERILSVGRADLNSKARFWVTPADIVRHLNAGKSVSSVRLYPSSLAKVKIALDALNPEFHQVNHARLAAWDKLALKDAKASGDPAYSFLMASYNDYDFQNSRENSGAYYENKKTIKEIFGDADDAILDLSEYKNPAHTINDQQVRLGYRWNSSASFQTASFLFAGHFINDKNSEYFSENEVVLGDITVAHDVARGSSFLDRLTMYSIKSYMPFDEFTRLFGGELDFGIMRIPENEKTRYNFFVNAGVGKSFEFFSDINAFAEIFGAARASDSSCFSGIGYKAGVIVRELFDMKTVATCSSLLGAPGDVGNHSQCELSQQKYLGNIGAISFRLKKGEHFYNDSLVRSIDASFYF